MTFKTYLICFVAGLIGQAFHTFVEFVKIKKRAKVANTSMTLQQYIANDKWPMMLNVAALLLELFILDDIAKWQPVIMNYFKFFFVAFGYMGSSLLLSALSQAQAKINKVVDVNTDKADGK